jgi:PKHD-type hydroxylase
MILEDKGISVIPKFLSNEECDFILNKCDNSLIPAGVYNAHGSEHLKQPRKSKVAFVDNLDNINNKIINEVNNKIHKQNGYELYIESFQFTKYEIGDYFDWHFDSNADIYKDRIYTIVIQLNDEYTSGDFQLMLENSITLKPGKGTMYMFPSSLLHRVTPIKTGVRYSLVSWLKLKKIQNYKKNII